MFKFTVRQHFNGRTDFEEIAGFQNRYEAENYINLVNADQIPIAIHPDTYGYPLEIIQH